LDHFPSHSVDAVAADSALKIRQLASERTRNMLIDNDEERDFGALVDW
jgi:hypothetical protein